MTDRTVNEYFKLEAQRREQAAANERLDRIEAKLDALLAALDEDVDHDEAGETVRVVTMDGDSYDVPAGPMTL